MKIVPVCCLLALLPLAGCASFHPVTASPLEVGQKYRTNMIAYTQRMQNASASEEERGWILYERAGLFLTLGMLDYARSDYRTIIYLPRGWVLRTQDLISSGLYSPITPGVAAGLSRRSGNTAAWPRRTGRA